MDLDLAQVRAFVTAADRRGFSRAAEQLHLSQQALSKRISRLEAALGTALFVRTRHGVELTRTGGDFLPFARELLRLATPPVDALADDAEAAVRLDLLDNRLSPRSLLRRLAEHAPGLPEPGTSGGTG